jgi:hypothetical protein
MFYTYQDIRFFFLFIFSFSYRSDQIHICSALHGGMYPLELCLKILTIPYHFHGFSKLFFINEQIERKPYSSYKEKEIKVAQMIELVMSFMLASNHSIGYKFYSTFLSCYENIKLALFQLI